MPRPRVSSLQASAKTKRRHSFQLAEVCEAVSGGGGEAAQQQLGDELDKDGREKLVCSKDFTVSLTTEESLAMKVSLVLPRNKLRIMRRYTNGI